MTTIEADEDETSNEEQTEQSSSLQWDTENLLESSMRITLATFGGGLVGFALQRQQAPNTTTSQSPNVRRRGPPSAIRQVNSLPKTWGFSCMMFALILETSRLASPSSKIYPLLWESNSGDNGQKREDDNFERQAGYQGLVTVTDFAIGGAVAGLAGAMANRGSPHGTGSRLQLPSAILRSGRRPFILSGVGTGLGLGIAAGILQAASVVGDMYVERQNNPELTNTK